MGGDKYQLINAFNKINAKGGTGTGIANATDMTEEELANYANNALNQYKNDENQTQKTLQNVTLENLMNELSVEYEKLGNWGDIIASAIKTLGTTLITYIGTKIIGGVIGKGIGLLSGAGGAAASAGSGGLFGTLGSLLGSAGPVVGAVGGVALGIGAVAGTVALINSKVSQKNQGDVVTTNTAAGNVMSAYRNMGKSETETYSAGWDEIGVQGDNGIFVNGGESNATFTAREKGVNGHYYTSYKTFDDYYNSYINGGNTNFSVTGNTQDIMEVFSWQDKEFRQKMGLDTKWNQSGYTEAHNALQLAIRENDALKYNQIKSYALRSFLEQNPQIPADYVLAALSAALILEGGANDPQILDAINGEYGFHGTLITNKKTLADVMAQRGITEANQLSVIYDMFWHNSGVDFWLMRQGGTGWMGHPDNDTLKSEFNLHRQGLSSVPYDNYLASLHEGEAILTASTASELRNLLDEYRSNNYNAQVIEIAIQTQTIELVNKLDELISIIGSSPSNTITTSTVDQILAKTKLLSSMTHMTSTKATQ